MRVSVLQARAYGEGFRDLETRRFGLLIQVWCVFDFRGRSFGDWNDWILKLREGSVVSFLYGMRGDWFTWWDC